MKMFADDKIEMVLITEDSVSQAMLKTAEKAANSNANILITGETGVGKELIARYIHLHSPFKKGPYISVNCAALPENMIESILFGYEKGAFTGAINSFAGKFEQAQEGTLLLDEIAEIPLNLQAKLLRVLQERELERLGGKKLIKVNVRIIAATNRDLKHEVKTGYFRKDLFYRLNVIPIVCIPLRERAQDIIPLVNYFIKKYAENDSIDLTEKAKRKLMNYQWPGNIRELENVMQRALIMLSSNVIDENDIQFTEVTDTDDSPIHDQLNSKIKANEAKLILDVLNEVDGSRDSAAKRLNISPRTLRYKLSKLKSIGIKIP